MDFLRHATLELVELDDIWHAYNLIFPGDRITSKTCRSASDDTPYQQLFTLHFYFKIHKQEGA